MHIVERGWSFAAAAVCQMGSCPVNAITGEQPHRLAMAAESLRACPCELSARCSDMMAALSPRWTVERLALFFDRPRVGGSGSCPIRLPLATRLLACHLGLQRKAVPRNLATLREVRVETQSAVIIAPDIAPLRQFARLDEE